MEKVKDVIISKASSNGKASIEIFTNGRISANQRDKSLSDLNLNSDTSPMSPLEADHSFVDDDCPESPYMQPHLQSEFEEINNGLMRLYSQPECMYSQPQYEHSQPESMTQNPNYMDSFSCLGDDCVPSPYISVEQDSLSRFDSTNYGLLSAHSQPNYVHSQLEFTIDNNPNHMAKFSYFSVDFFESPYIHDEPHGQSGFESPNYGLMRMYSEPENLYSLPECVNDISNYIGQTEGINDDFCDEWYNSVLNEGEINIDNTLTECDWIDETENNNISSNREDDDSPFSTKKLMELYHLCKNDNMVTFCNICHATLTEGPNIVLFMSRGFCSHECRDIFQRLKAPYL